MKIVCIGDSLTSGYGVSSKERWTTIIGEAYKLTVVNKGINGETTSDMLLRSYEDVIVERPSHVIIMGGTNDFFKMAPVSRVKGNIEELIREALLHDIKPILGIQPPIVEAMAKEKWSATISFKKVEQDLIEYRQWAMEFCKAQGILYLDFYLAFKELVEEEDKIVYYLDGIHPTRKGHRLMASQCNLQGLLTL